MGNKAIQATIGGKIDDENTNLLDKFFEIPPYQRLYEWEKEQIETLLDDMKKAWKPDDCQSSKSNADLQKSSQQYFIGNITTSKKSENGQEKFVLIDGQQRLTTLWFIGFYLASRECEWEKEITKRVWQNFILQDDKLRITMPIRDKEKEALENLAKKIQKPNSQEKLEFSKDLQGIHQKIIDAFKCIESWFGKTFDKDYFEKKKDTIKLDDFAKYICENICFVFVELAQNTDLNRFFVRMNNRGKQLEKHEILKARILDKIKDDKSDEWQKYAKIWDLCSDMNKYIFQSASDRNILNSENESGDKWGIDKIISEFDDKNTKSTQNDDTADKVESIIDFPTFLLHCYKLWVAKKCGDQIEKIIVAQDKLLENFNLSKMDSELCKCFIVDMLYYRVLFDYFVIKNNDEQGNGFKIRRLQPYKNKYYRLPEDSKSATDSPLLNLEMIQNYLRVARQGERQNYHHWLTPFLKYLSEDNDNKSIKEYLDLESWNPKEICEKFINRFEKLPEVQQSKFVSFLEDLDSKLAICHMGVKGENGMLDITNSVIVDLDLSLSDRACRLISVKKNNFDEWFELNRGTATAHYWFYRLEYYLWKNKQKFADIKFGGQSFENIADKFYFRNLNSVEHIQPQSRAEDEEKNWHIYKDNESKIIKRDIDCFGNLALLSVGFNSSLSNQDNADKRLDLQKKINKSEVESLKLWLVYALYIKDSNEWTYEKAKAHGAEMLNILKESFKDS